MSTVLQLTMPFHGFLSFVVTCVVKHLFSPSLQDKAREWVIKQFVPICCR
jgi:hypothetical protein